MSTKIGLFVWVTLIILPAIIILFWNVGVAGVAHVHTIHSYWTAVALAFGVNLLRYIVAAVGSESTDVTVNQFIEDKDSH